MAFKMQCPKCEGQDFSIERDNRTFGAVAQAFELVFHCRCGKQMFGDQLVKEYETQKQQYEAEGHPADEDEAALPGQDMLGAVLGTVVNHPTATLAEARRRDEEDRLWREKVQGSALEAVPSTTVDVKSTSSDQRCVWPGCDKPRRANSKYCSRACSNKNARARHKARQKKGKKGKTAIL